MSEYNGRNAENRQSGDRGGASRGAGNRSGGPRGPQRGPKVSPARLAAYDVMRDVTDREAYANLALPARIREAGIDHRDTALVTELVAGSLRMRGRYDRIIEIASGRDTEHIDARTLNVLRLGVHQLLGMRTASHAAVNESVELQRLVASPNGAGFVNGVLRAIGRTTPEEWDERIAETAKSKDDALAAQTSHPTWVLRALRASLKAEGRDAELVELLEADNVAPRVNLALLPGFDEELIEDVESGSFEAITFEGPSPIGFMMHGGDPARAIEAAQVHEGALRVQDQGSQLAALALTRARPVQAGERWLDLCSGPGGKSALLGAEARLAGATVRANEVAPHRAELVRNAVEAVASTVNVVSFDGREEGAYDGQQYDRILVDAPCSGLGALRRRPEARWRKTPGDLPDLTQLQGELLDAAVAHLAVGGVLAYVTCSPHLAETRVSVERLLGRHADLKELDAREVVTSIARGPIDLAGDQLSVQLWPHRHGTDAMFIALFTKTEESAS
ncbi:16S rRNA (cytosine967-C5)-methyltransferase [Leucobacter exalbidus]|uniref:16S rRNA (Cytosine967-C5)-methyltransferase n=1 Tax=Leucobacter exalbidus TaxID=662960 RepID=A0A940T2W2_9MICO|nr:16S rRNA (cytosine967-C5)-methyltransferase [Leucobacter exalbidus]